LRLEDARKEILDRIGKVNGVAINEDELSPAARQSITSLAVVMRQLVMTKQLLLMEEESYNTFGSRMKRAVTQKNDGSLMQHITQINVLQKDLDSKIQEAAGKILQEMQARWTAANLGGPSAMPMVSHLVLEPLKCKNCGATLESPSSRTVKCSYCGAEYAIAEYLDQVGSVIKSSGNPKEKETPQQ
jgi:hypothetical protein